MQRKIDAQTVVLMDGEAEKHVLGFRLPSGNFSTGGIQYKDGEIGIVFYDMEKWRTPGTIIKRSEAGPNEPKLCLIFESAESLRCVGKKMLMEAEKMEKQKEDKGADVIGQSDD